uniref:Peptidase S1 domain-containing protein n=1 Tax=Homalodisca liturata TaxID=320908 RepID=A0A1B6K003_9HEMI
MRCIFITTLALFIADIACKPENGFRKTEYTSHPNWRLLPTNNCGRPKSFHDGFSTRVFGGYNAQLGQYPWMAQLVVVNARDHGHACGGSIISNKYILTAAHCFEVPYALIVKLGELELDTNVDCTPLLTRCAPPAIFLDIELVIIHPKYRFTGGYSKYDVALVRCRQEIQFNDYIKPICLPTFAIDDSVLLNSTLEVAGWGASEIEETNNFLQVLNAQFVPKVYCIALFNNALIDRHICSAPYVNWCNVDINDEVICANVIRGKGTCYGDSGGPLMMQHSTPGGIYTVLLGVLSYGLPDPSCASGVPDVYTSVPDVVPWILDSIYE